MGKRSKFSKRQKTYKHDPDVADFIEAAAPLSKMAQGQFVDECVKRQGMAVVKGKLVLREKTTVEAVARLFRKLRP